MVVAGVAAASPPHRDMNTTEVASPSTSFGYYKVPPVDKCAPPKRKYYYYKLESESSYEEYDGYDESGSEQSIQGKETDLVKDTSDTDWSSDESVVEYEVVSSSEEKAFEASTRIVDGSGSSDTDNDIITTTVISVTNLSEKNEATSDNEDSLTGASTDSELSPFDYWKCAQCHAANNNPMFRYCEKCYKVRKDFFPPRPKRKRPKCKKGKKQKPRSFPNIVPNNKIGTVFGGPDGAFRNGINTIKAPTMLDFHKIVVPDSLKSSKCSIGQSCNASDSDGSNCKNDRKRKQADGGPQVKRKKTDDSHISVINKNVNSNESLVLLSESFNVEPEKLELPSPASDTVTSFSQPEFPTFVDLPSKTMSDPIINISKDDMCLVRDDIKHFSDNENKCSSIPALKRQNSSDSDKCITCLVEPKSGVFVHGRIAHICCCYKCSVKVWIKTKRCPICNCRVSNVLKAFVI